MITRSTPILSPTPQPIRDWARAPLTRPMSAEQADLIADVVGAALYPGYGPPPPPPLVVGTHVSKSVLLPVCLAEYTASDGALVSARFRGNYHDWAISVAAQTSRDDVGGWGLFSEASADALYTGCFEGFAAARIFGTYAADRRRFSCHIEYSTEALYMFLRLLRGRQK